MADVSWLYKLIETLDIIADATQVNDDVPNVMDWIEEIRQGEQDRCAEIINEYARRAWQLSHEDLNGELRAQVAEHLVRTITGVYDG